MGKCITIFYLLIGILSSAQERDYLFKQISTDNGLSQSSVIAIAQDRLGQMWFGTRNGLNKYDGNNFTVYRNNPLDSISISNSDILSIMEDRSGKIWVGTYNGLNRYDPLTNSFKRFFHRDDSSSLSNNTVWCITEMQNGKIWIGTSNGLSIYDPETEKFRSLYSSNTDDTSLSSNYIPSIFQEGDGTIWVGTSNGLCQLNSNGENDGSFQCFNRFLDGQGLFIQDIIEYKPGILGVATKNQGFLMFSIETKKFGRSGVLSNLNDTSPDVRALVVDNENKLWTGTYDGIAILENDGSVYRAFHQTNIATSLSQDFVKCLFVDKKGSVWIGTYYGGLNIWDPSNTNFINFKQNGTKNGLSYNVVSSMVSDNEHNLYFGTEGGGLTIFNTHLDSTRFVDTSNTTGLPSNTIKSLWLDNQNELWIGCFNAGLSVYDTNKKKSLDHGIPDDLKNYLENSGVYAITQDNYGIMWLGTFGKGLVRYNTEKRQFIVFGDDPSGIRSLTSNRIRNLLADRNDHVWAGTQNGLNRLSPKQENYEIRKYFYDSKTGSGDDILTVFQSAKGEIWAGVKAKGLFKFNGEDFDRVSLLHGEPSTSVFAILEDGQGQLWMSSDRGILHYDPLNRTTVIYNQKDGLRSNEFHSNAAMQIGDSRFYFGGSSGVFSFDSQKMAKNLFSPQVILTDLKINNKSVPIDGPQHILTKSIAYTKAITLDHDKAFFTLDFALPNFVNPKNNKYSYRLVGLGDQWITTSKTEANYTIQRPGTYLFEVKGANNDGIWNSVSTQLTIKVRPAPWRTGWAFALYGILIVIALWGLLTIINSRTKLRHKLQLELIEKDRAEAAHQAKLQFFTNISHEFRTPLTLILGPLQQVLGDYRGSNLIYKKLMVMESSTKHLLQLINRLLDFRKLENHQSKLQVAEGNIVKFLKEIYLSFTEFAKDGGYIYTFDPGKEKILVYYDREKLEQAFYNLIANAFKYTPPGGCIAVAVHEVGDEIHISISDTGTGICEEYLDRVFDRYFEIPTNGNKRNGNIQGTGIGLSIVSNIVKLHKGSINVTSKEGQGSTFLVSIPSGRDHLSEEEILRDFMFSDDVDQYKAQLEEPELILQKEVGDLVWMDDRPTVLIVEDHVPLRSFMRNLLKNEYNILEAGNGGTAMEIALEHVPDLIISDVIMPEMVGTELCANIKRNLRTSHIPMILLTSRTALVYRFEGLESGADDYISKPFNVKEFQLRVKNLLESTRRLRDKFSKVEVLAPSELVVSSIDQKLLKKAIQIVEGHIANEQFDVKQFSGELGISRTMLFTKIKAWTNFTPNEFIAEIRLKRAAQILEQRKMAISQVSYEVGFKNPKYFSKCFAKKYGETPSKFMERFS